ncbi:MAG: histidine triad nucleotide-binding protein [Elusimicrobia bacterium RIFOXYA2_FULL_39_19]|nr:MAG: histidine triad nucleotide-binding protein [Elusimicrobia bacterium RIFOXYA2_FULL_39_19]
MVDCIFCKIVNKSIPVNLIFEDDEIIAFRDINPQAPVHVLIIPRKHIDSTMDISKTDESLIGRIHTAAQKIAINESVDKTGFRIVSNNGPDAGQAVAHLHFHLLGKRKLNWPPG